MKKSKLLFVTILTVLLLGLKSWSTGLNAIRENNANIKENTKSAGKHAPISIEGNDALATFIENEGLSGDGTHASPYVIENFIIDASTAHGIEIQSTDAYLIIRNCTIEGGNNNHGIHLNNCINVNLSNNLLNNTYIGIFLESSSNNTLSGNNANNNDFGFYFHSSSNNNTLIGNNASYSGTDGIYIKHSSNNNFSGNNVNYNWWYGFYLSSSNNNILSDNNVNNNNHQAIYLKESSNNNTITGNNVNYNNGPGLFLYSSSNNNTITSNNVNYNRYQGILLSSSSNNNTITSNNVNYNDGIGISLSSSSNNNTITSNNVNYNDGIGIYLVVLSKYNILSGNNVNYNTKHGIKLYSSSNNNTIYLNDIYGNLDGQAFEEAFSIDNQWDNGTIGNYWGVDYINNYPNATNDGKIWSIPYEINGTGNGIDHFPLVNEIVIDFDAPQFTDIPENLSDYEGYSDFCCFFWTVTDLYPATYTIELNGSEVVSATEWTDGSPINYNVPDGLLKGEHCITIIVTDESGNIAQDTVIFTVNDGEPPQFTDIPENLSDYEGYSDLNISWIATDLYPATYTIELNGILVVSPTAWTNGSAISYNIPDGLLIGDHKVTIIVTDESGNTAQNTFLFTVISTETTTTFTTTTTSEAEPGSFPELFTVLLCLGTIVVFTQRHKKA